jgi:hypothetical protein
MKDQLGSNLQKSINHRKITGRFRKGVIHKKVGPALKHSAKGKVDAEH